MESTMAESMAHYMRHYYYVDFYEFHQASHASQASQNEIQWWYIDLLLILVGFYVDLLSIITRVADYHGAGNDYEPKRIVSNDG